MRHTPELGLAATTRGVPRAPAPEAVPGFHLDAGYAPVAVPRKARRAAIRSREVGRLFSFDTTPEAATYLIRGEVEDDNALDRLSDAVRSDPNGVGVFSDPRISSFAVCPSGPVGSHADVANRLSVATLHNRGMNGSGVLTAIVDTGVNVAHLNARGMNPGFDAGRSWSPVPGSVLGAMPVDHGTMCAFDVCISAPECTLLDYALLQSRAQGGSVMDGFLSDAVSGFSRLLELMTGPDAPPALVVNNSWGMFHPSWDFEVGHPGNYSDNPEHPFNIIVESLEDAGADILFAAGNCGAECPDGRCQGATSEGIYGANSSASVLCVAGVTVEDVRLGYSTQGPGRLLGDKPDICAYTHFSGSGVYPNDVDGGTSAACPVAAGVISAIRSRYPASEVAPATLRNLIRRSANDLGMQGFDYDHGFGVIDVERLLNLLDRREEQPIAVGQTVSGHLAEAGATLTYRLRLSDALTIALDGPQGVDFDLYVRKGEAPTTDLYDQRGFTGSADEKIRVQPAGPGDYYVMVRAYRGSGAFTLKASLE
ncbi:MAG: S8 family serine peptidase [Gammaproteobacteria bacterium]|nr:S8 family serine peptidase [Gammaproteobacteria bacterium]